MEQKVNFEVSDVEEVSFENYDNEDEFAIARIGYLSTRPNSHKLVFSDEVFKEYAPTILGKWVVAKMNILGTDATTHTPSEVIMGVIPPNQEVEFVEDDDGYIRAYVKAVISKMYARKFYNMFKEDNERAVSVEFRMSTENNKDLDDNVEAFNITAVTVLGKDVRPSCPESDIKIVRFSQEDANVFFDKVQSNSPLSDFMKQRKVQMSEKKTYKIDKSKESLSTKSWGDVDKADMRDKIMNAKNRNSLVKAVYMLVEDGWEDAPSEHLKYPVMELKGDTFVYNREGLSSAIGYAKKEEETSVVNKLKKIYKNLDLEDEGKEDEAKLSEVKEINFAAVDIADMWDKIWDALYKREQGYNYSIVNVYEEDNQKFAIIKKRGDEVLYRLDFSLTEEGLTLADEITQVSIEVVESDKVQKFAEFEGIEKYREFAEEDKKDEDDSDSKVEEKVDEKDEAEDEDKADKADEKEAKEAEMSCDEMKAEMARLQSEIENRDNIIMEKDTELADLREFKATCLEAERTSKVDSVMSSVAEFMNADTAKTYREKGMSVDFAEVDAWANEVKASVFEKVANKKDAQKAEFTRMSGASNEENLSGKTALERLKSRYC